MNPDWYRDAIIYELDVETFQDSDGDGVGDFRGLISRLDYLVDLGVTCLWLQPIYPTPNRDNGYDVTDYREVDSRLGTLDDFREFVRAATQRDLRVILDLPINATSNQHPWFQAARRDTRSNYHHYYVWRDEPPQDQPSGVFGGPTWSYDQVANRYYHHSFYDFQPDLNIGNPEVQGEVKRTISFWLQFGVSGFRMDAVPFLIHEVQIEPRFQILKELHAHVRDENPQAVLLGEVDLNLLQLRQYFSLGSRADQMDMLLNFWMCNYLLLALTRKNARPLVWALDMLPRPPQGGQWANFLRNHDELSLGRLSDTERQEVFEVFAPEPNMRAYGRGIRRRLAPMLGGDTSRLKLVHSLLMSLPGTPVLYYGEEIGMGDDLSLRERNTVRTPMQWNGEPGAGFSSVDREAMPRPVITQGAFDFHQVNVERQRSEQESLLNFVRRAVRVRRNCKAIGQGRWRNLDSGHSGVLSHHYDYEGLDVFLLHSLTNDPVEAHLEPHEDVEEVLADREYPHPQFPRVPLARYGFRWFSEVDHPHYGCTSRASRCCA